MFLLLNFFFSICFGQEIKSVKDPVLIYAQKLNKELFNVYHFKGFEQRYLDLLLVRINFDINNDGLNDIAIASSFEEGNAGFFWDIYLGEKTGTYRHIEPVFFHPDAFAIHPKDKNQTELFTYHRMGADEGYLEKYNIYNSGIKLEKSETIHVNANMEDKKKYDELFNNNKSNKPLVENCYLHEYLEKRTCKWMQGYYREK